MAGLPGRMRLEAREIARMPLSLLTRLRLVLFGHEDLAGLIFWAALVGIGGALASVAFREAIRLLRERTAPRTVELGPASIASILAAVLGSSDVDLDIGAASVTPQTTH